MKLKEFIMLSETMNITVVDHQPDEKLDTLSDLCFYLYKKIGPIFSKIPSEQKTGFGGMQIFEPDGEDFDDPTGIINFYTGKLSEINVNLLLKAAIYWLADVGAQVGKPISNTHQDYITKQVDQIRQYPEDELKSHDQKIQDFHQYYSKQGHDINAVRVVRIPVISRKEKEDTNDPPTMNIANDSAHLLFHSVLGFPDSPGGYGPINIRDIIIKLENMSKFEKGQHVVPPTDSQDEKGPRIIDQGYDIDRIEGYIQRLVAICKWALENGYDSIECN